MYDVVQIARDAAARVAAIRLTRTQKIVVVSAAVAAAAYIAKSVMGGEDEVVSNEMGLTDSSEIDLVKTTLGQVFTTLGQVGIVGYAAVQAANQPQQNVNQVSNSFLREKAESPSLVESFVSNGINYNIYNTPSGNFASQSSSGVSALSPSQGLFSSASPSVSNGVSAESPSRGGSSVSNGIAESPSAPSPSGVSATGVASLRQGQNNLAR